MEDFHSTSNMVHELRWNIDPHFRINIYSSRNLAILAYFPHVEKPHEDIFEKNVHHAIFRLYRFSFLKLGFRNCPTQKAAVLQ